MDVGHDVALQCMHRLAMPRCDVHVDYTVVKVKHTQLTPYDLSNFDGRISYVQASMSRGSHIRGFACHFLYSDKIMVSC